MKYLIETLPDHCTTRGAGYYSCLKSYIEDPRVEAKWSENTIFHTTRKPAHSDLVKLIEKLPNHQIIYFANEPKVIEKGNWLDIREQGKKYGITICKCRYWKIGQAVHIGRDVSLGWRVEIGDGAQLCGSIVTGDSTLIGANAHITAPDKYRKYLLKDIPDAYNDLHDEPNGYFYIAP